MAFLDYVKAAASRALPAVPVGTNALVARLTGINRFGLTGFLSLETAPAENTQLLRQGYDDNHIVFTVADWKAQQLAKAPPILYEVKDKKSHARYKALTLDQKAQEYTLRRKAIEEVDDESDPLVRLLHHPNSGQTWAEFAYGISVYYDFGNALIYGVELDAGPNAGQFRELYLLPTAIYSGANPSPEGYEYFIDSIGLNERVPGSQVLHLRRFNTRDEAEGGGLWGMSKLAPARRVLTKSTQAQEAEAELFLNRGARSIVFPKNMGNNEPPSAEEAQRAAQAMTRKLRQAGNGGIASNSLELGVIHLGMNSDELKLMESNALTERQLAALWHVDVIAVFSAVTEASRANGETAVRKSLIEGVLPDQALIAQKLNGWLLPAYNRVNKYQRYIEFNTDVYPQLQTDKAGIMDWMERMGSSINERRAAMGYEADPDPACNVKLVPPGYTAIGELVADKVPSNDGTYKD